MKNLKGRWRRQEMTSGRLKTTIRGRKWVVETEMVMEAENGRWGAET